MTIDLPLGKLEILYIICLKAKPIYFTFNININIESLITIQFVKNVIIPVQKTLHAAKSRFKCLFIDIGASSPVSALLRNLLDEPIDSKIIQRSTFLETIYPCKGDIKYNLAHLLEHFNENSDDLLLDDYIYHALLLFYRLYYKEVLNKSNCLDALNASTRDELFKRLSLAKDFMLSNYNQDISLEDISGHSCLSPTHLFRTFKQIYNCSPHQFLIQTRLNNARHMLKNTDYTLNEIVNLVGFTCPSTFIKLFKTKFHFTPGSYRNLVA